MGVKSTFCLPQFLAKMERTVTSTENGGPTTSTNNVETRVPDNNTNELTCVNTVRFDDIAIFMKEYDPTQPITSFFNKFDEIRNLFQLTDIQSMAFCRKLLKGEVEAFLNSIPLQKQYEEFKTIVIKEFKSEVNVAEIHRRLKNEKKGKEESYVSYYYRLKEIAATGNLDDASTKYYLISGSGTNPEIQITLQMTKSNEDLKNIFKCLDGQQSDTQAKFAVPRMQIQSYARPQLQNRNPIFRQPGHYRPWRPTQNQFRPQSSPWRFPYQQASPYRPLQNPNRLQFSRPRWNSQNHNQGNMYHQQSDQRSAHLHSHVVSPQNPSRQ